MSERLNLTSGPSLARIGRSVNEKYRALASSIGLQTTARGVATATTVIGNRALTFGPTPTAVMKTYAVYDATVSPVRMLSEISFDEMRNAVLGTSQARRYAVQNMAATTVTIRLDATPTTAYVLTADVEVNLATLSGVQVPAFAESFHDLLVYGGMSIELEKMEKYEMAKAQSARCEARISDLRMFIAKSAYREIYQGKTSPVGRRAG